MAFIAHIPTSIHIICIFTRITPEMWNKEVDSAIAQPEKSSSPQQVISATLNRKMEERATIGEIPSMQPTTPALITEVSGTYDNNHIYNRTCVMEKTIFQWLSGITDVIGLAGNAAVIWLLGFRMHRNAISVYILNLAVADFLYLCFDVIADVQKFTTNFLYSNSYLYFVFQFELMSSYAAGLSFLSLISLERCLSVLCPIWYRCHRPSHASSYMCVLLWALCLTFIFLQSYYCEIEKNLYHQNWCLSFRLSIAGYLLFLLVILSGSNLALMVRMFCGSQRRSLTRLYMTVLLTVLVFIICGLPCGILFFLIYRLTINFHYLPCYLHELLFFLSSVNSCGNPIIYFFVGTFRQRQWQTLKQVLQRALQDTPEDSELAGSLSPDILEMSGSRVEPC
ncbi:PREDICTED: mas-related G-protein coupled receptor member A-like [Dipodomys ordii]|uniref:Mas-related G-protein coupled receptor member A-like n=1 Tax=Dipodomys ordii TaxID=10020 RepID=A0A1S3FGD4_DIPOR|nr:PREDICTED: mas-related G-protein coupled receptor member A-like [Dipodomys ordii]